MSGSRRAYEMRHTVSFEETNLVGNVYYANHVRWQGRCREMFLRDHCPEIIRQLSGDLALVTVRCSCEYLAELGAFDEVLVRMTLDEMLQNRIAFSFEYLKVDPGGTNTLCARGEHQVAAMRRTAESGLVPCPVPDALRKALEAYA